MADGSLPAASGPPRADAWRRLRRDGTSMAGAGCLLALVLVACLAPVLAPYDPIKVAMRERLQGPSARHLLGTDQFGRDILSRIMYGARISLAVGLIAVGIGLGVGATLGLVAGFSRRLDYPIVALMDVLLSFPQILLAIAIVAALGPGIFNAMIAVGIGAVPGFTRLARSSMLSIRERDYVESARALGATSARIVARHVLPNALAPLIVVATLSLAGAILAAAILSFLGLGAQPPMAEWGAMAADGRGFIAQHPHIATFPSLAIFVVVLASNLLGDGLRDALDPRLDE
ncbi:MAG TPA: ABC transporter permease [Candidatus Methylomirabilis sp.]|nr:ABC transporter permease [Candidatus Methylomirabilis sp.]